MLDLNDLINLKVKKEQTMYRLQNKRRELMSQIDSINEYIENNLNDYNTLYEAINRKIHRLTPKIEIAKFGKDIDGITIYGAVISFPDVNTKFYKIIDDIHFLGIDPKINNYELHNRIRDLVEQYLLNINYNDLIDFTPREKNVIEKQIALMKKAKLERNTFLTMLD
jgi:hypothetical protein